MNRKLLIVASSLPFLPGCGGYGHMGGGNWPFGMNMGYGGGFMWILIILIIGVIAWSVWRKSQPGLGTQDRPSIGHRETPLEIAKRRYAQGEITREEFEQIKQDLE